jgi:hypothetical protein
MSYVMKRLMPKCFNETTLISNHKLTLIDMESNLTVRHSVTLYVRGRVRRSINEIIKNHIAVALTWMIDVSIFQTRISPLSSSERLKVTESILKEL